MEQKQHINQLPRHVNPPEQVEATNSTSQAVGAASRAVQRSEQDGQHHDGQDDASEPRTAQLNVEDLPAEWLLHRMKFDKICAK